MAKSVRLDPELEALLERASRALDVSQSELIREALLRRCQEVLGPSLSERLQPVIGLIESSGGRASDTGAAFRQILARKRAR
jgi:hypothetical protein